MARIKGLGILGIVRTILKNALFLTDDYGATDYEWHIRFWPHALGWSVDAQRWKSPAGKSVAFDSPVD